MSSPRPARRASIAALMLAGAVSLSACAPAPAGTNRPDAAGQPASPAASARPLQDPSVPVPTPDADRRPPTGISIPAIGVEAPLEVLSLDQSDVLQAPRAWDAAGWYDSSPVPGDQGPSIITGHLTAPDGPAVFIDLGALVPGDLVTVTRADGSTSTFAVDRTITAERTDSFPTAEIYGPTPDAQLRLITCDGEYDPARDHWTRNMVVFATELPL
ncbi:sortase domain-containing protein [Arthrobacter sp. TMS1-12-1]